VIETLEKQLRGLAAKSVEIIKKYEAGEIIDREKVRVARSMIAMHKRLQAANVKQEKLKRRIQKIFEKADSITRK
jgi:sialic acid synthase SpsE